MVVDVAARFPDRAGLRPVIVARFRLARWSEDGVKHAPLSPGGMMSALLWLRLSVPFLRSRRFELKAILGLAILWGARLRPDETARNCYFRPQYAPPVTCLRLR